MSSKRNPVALIATRPERAAKTNEGKLITIIIKDIDRQQTSISFSRQSISSSSFNIDALGAMISTLLQIQKLDNRFRNLESIIEKN